MPNDPHQLAAFNPEQFLANTGLGRTIRKYRAKQHFFNQGDPCDALFYIQSGRAKLSVISSTGKEATITLLGPNDFVGEEAIAAVCGLRLASAVAITACTALRIERTTMLKVLEDQPSLSNMFTAFILARSMKTQSDLVDQLFNNTEKRLARILLLMSEIGKSDVPDTLLPEITQTTLAEMVGTTRSRVNVFLNRFRSLGFIEYNGRIKVHKSLLNVVLHD
jgi:CRP/FNR family cyclic AMP-dependent transcriptional regulator